MELLGSVSNMWYLFSSVYSVSAVSDVGMTVGGNRAPGQGFASTCIFVRRGDWIEGGKEKVLMKTRSLMSLYNQQ